MHYSVNIMFIFQRMAHKMWYANLMLVCMAMVMVMIMANKITEYMHHYYFVGNDGK